MGLAEGTRLEYKQAMEAVGRHEAAIISCRQLYLLGL